ncbi:MAG TPA: hypothetical protein VIM61_12790 [Chthoniobacterales bacterium]|jgi:hypothetical protein
MELTQLTPAALSELIQLVEKKQSLLDQIAKIEADMEAVVTGKAPKTAVARAPRTPAPPKAAPAPKEAPAPKAAAPVRAKRGALKEGILAALEAAGPEGLSVSELSNKLGVEPANVHVWFSTTGKKLTEISKVAAGRYALGAAAPVAAAAVVEEAPAATPEPAHEHVAAVLEAPAESKPEAVSTPEPAPAAPEPIVEETPVIDPVVEEAPVAESTIELEPEADAPAPEDVEDSASKRDELLLSSD